MSPADPPALQLRNQLLIALPGLSDPNFARSVTLLCQHDGEGAMGVMINRASDYLLGEVFDQMEVDCTDPAMRARQVLVGGPVHPQHGFVLHDGGAAWDSSVAISDRLWVTTSRDVLEAAAAGQGPQRMLVALGCAGWGAGQLEYEIGENSWLTVPADPDLLFDTPLEHRWQAAAGRIGVNIAHLPDYAGHA